ncbi:MAG: fibronectin type III domain-containing protein [Fibromonadales bacterium]|nr:fibronectin type III domain-containing protein [Fibromonadales bacterium]
MNKLRFIILAFTIIFLLSCSSEFDSVNHNGSQEQSSSSELAAVVSSSSKQEASPSSSSELVAAVSSSSKQEVLLSSSSELVAAVSSSSKQEASPSSSSKLVAAVSSSSELVVLSSSSEIVSSSSNTPPPPPPAAPSVVLAVTQSSKNILISWNPISEANSYEIYRSTSETGTYSLVGTAISTSYTDTGLNKTTTYYYKIKSVNNNGSSEFSNYGSAVTKNTVKKVITKEYSVGNGQAYTYNDVFPATIEVYALGAGGGGQGGYYWNGGVMKSARDGTGASGGGGGAVYMKLTVSEIVDVAIDVGNANGGDLGGYGNCENAGGGVFKNTGAQYTSGHSGRDGGTTKVVWVAKNITLTANGGGGAWHYELERGDGNMYAGSGGKASIVSAITLEDSATAFGEPGMDGANEGCIQGRGGNAASISKGYYAFFGGGLGGYKTCGSGGDYASNTTYHDADIGAGGTGGCGDRSISYGRYGGNGKVVIVVTYEVDE